MDTREIILDAFKHCVANTSYDKTSIEDICRKANVSRRTFYRYFDSKLSACRAVFEQDIIQPVRDIYNLIDMENVRSSATIVYERGLKKMREDQAFYSKVFTRRHPQLLELYIDLVVDSNRPKFEKGLDDPEELELAIYVNAVANTYGTAKWVEEGFKIPPEVMTQYLLRWIYGRNRELDDKNDRWE